MSGILADGKVWPVDGVKVIGSHEAAWAHLTPGDCTPRNGAPFQFFIHKTIADDPEKLILGAGPSGGAGGAEYTAEFWASDPGHSGTQLIAGLDGTLACLCDIIRTTAYGETVSNPYSVGIETKELVGGGFYEASGHTVVKACIVSCRAMGTQLIAQWPYHGRPLARMLNGGRDCYGIFGHRDNTTARGKWDPGDMIYDFLRDAGVVLLDFESNQDRTYVETIQQSLTNDGFYKGRIDGLAGKETRNALAAAGYIDGIHALGKAA